MLGHEAYGPTMNIYGYSLEESKRVASDKFSELLKMLFILQAVNLCPRTEKRAKKKSSTSQINLDATTFSGYASYRDRTYDLRVTSALLYQLS